MASIIGAVRASPPSAVLPPHWMTALCGTLALASLLYLGALVHAGSAQTLEALALIGLPALAAGAALSLLSLAPRCLRWLLLLRWSGHRLPWRISLRIYLAGLALSSTPGKLGETLRSVLLAARGVPVQRSLAAFLADRGADVIAVALLGALCGWLAGTRQGLLEGLALGLSLGSLLLARLLREPALLRRFVTAPAPQASGRGARARAWLLGGGRDWAMLWSGRRMLIGVGLAMLAYGLQGLVFVGFVQRMAPEIPAATCMVMLANAILIGAASLLPGGLGAMESALVLQLLALQLDWPQAVAAVLAARLCTLWLVWLLGLAALASCAGPPATDDDKDRLG